MSGESGANLYAPPVYTVRRRARALARAYTVCLSRFTRTNDAVPQGGNATLHPRILPYGPRPFLHLSVPGFEPAFLGRKKEKRRMVEKK